MTSIEDEWQQAVVDAVSVGKCIAETAEEFDLGCGHIVQLLQNASLLLQSGSSATAAFLTITAMEEIAKLHVGIFRKSTENPPRNKDPLFRHNRKHYLATMPTLGMGSRHSKCYWRKPNAGIDGYVAQWCSYISSRKRNLFRK